MTAGAPEHETRIGEAESRRDRWAVGIVMTLVIGTGIAGAYVASSPPGDELAHVGVTEQARVVRLDVPRPQGSN